MRLFVNLPIKHKLTAISLITTLAALVLTCAGFIVYDQIVLRRDVEKELNQAAELLGFNTTAALAFGDADSARQTLKALVATPQITSACVYDKDGKFFSSYHAPGDAFAFGPPPSAITLRLRDDHFELFRPIRSDHETVGTIFLRANRDEMRDRLRRYALISAIVVLIAIGAAYLIASRLQSVISAPVSELATIASRVAADQDYTVRATPRGEDELGQLIVGFNEMLGQIQARDDALRAARDHLEQRVAERTAKLAEASGLLEAMLENSPDLIFFKDEASRFVRFSKAFLRRFEVADPEMLRGKTDADFYAPAHAEPARADEERIVRTGEAMVGKLERETYRDGRTTWVLTTKMPWRDGNGRIVGTFGISKDVTALKEAEDRLAYERDQLRALLDSSPDTIYFKDAESRFALVSRSKVRNTLERVPDLRQRRAARGLDANVAEPELLTGLTDFDTYQEADARKAQHDEHEVMRTGQPIIGKLEKQSFLDGVIRWSLTSKMPWRDREGRIMGTFGISKDVTDLKDAEEKLKQLHQQLMETSRQAGMAEVATGVLHNVGNVLNSVNVSATLVSDQVRHTKAANVAKLAALFAQNKANLAEFLLHDSRGRMIPDYLETLAESLTQEQATITTELEHLRKNIEHIKEIVAMQQAYARTSGVIETVSVPDLIEDALRMNAGSLARHDVTTHRDYQVRGVVTTDKHKVIQILINLVRNAKYACDESGRSDKQITVRTSGGDGGVEIAVIDNGVGIAPENLTRIFNHGFTTRKHGHGFGLHSGALAARELGGQLSAHSDGPGRGATFVLQLPHKSHSAGHDSTAA